MLRHLAYMSDLGLLRFYLYLLQQLGACRRNDMDGRLWVIDTLNGTMYRD